MHFKIRQDTTHIYIHIADIGGLSASELHREAWRAGKFAVDYHYILQENGEVEEGRAPYEVAGPLMENAATSIYILADSNHKKRRLSDTQRFALEELLSSLKGEYPEAKICIKKR